MKYGNAEKNKEMRLSFQEMVSSNIDEWAVINDQEQRIQRLEKLLKDLKLKFEKRDFKS